jgi:hypothetical protein
MRLPPAQDSLQLQTTPFRQQESERESLEFKSILSGKAETSDGSPYSFHLYKSSDGVSISTRFERRGSPARAKGAMRKIIKRAVKVLERESKMDSNGKQVGERAVLMLTSKDSDKVQAVVLWRDGSHLYYIESSSLQHTLEFEESLYANKQ